MSKLAIALQVCPLDVWTAQRLARLICSIQEKRNDIEFIVSARRGTNPDAVKQLAAIAKEGFTNVHVVNGKRFGTGWPNGCNDLWAETIIRTTQLAEAGKIRATGVLTFESDCIPLRPDWLDIIAAAWKEAERKNLYCVGHAHRGVASIDGEPTPEPTHINGNAVFSVGIIKRFPQLMGSDARAGWDAYHGKLLLNIGEDTNTIFQRYRIKQIEREEVEAIRKNGEIPGMFHGIKGTDGLAAVEAMVADGTFMKRTP